MMVETSEALMVRLTKTLNDEQNALFTLIIEDHCAMGVSVKDMLKKYDYMIDISLTQAEFDATFDVLNKVLNAHTKQGAANWDMDPDQ